jgi:hypothetical protein
VRIAAGVRGDARQVEIRRPRQDGPGRQVRAGRWRDCLPWPPRVLGLQHVRPFRRIWRSSTLAWRYAQRRDWQPRGGRGALYLGGCPHRPEYLAQIRETISLTGRPAPGGPTPQMRDELEVYRRRKSVPR